MKLLDHIQKHYGGNQAAFAKAQDVKPQQVTQWIKGKFIVVDGVLYSPRRTLSAASKSPMKIVRVAERIDLDFTPVYGYLRRAIVERYESYLSDNEDDDEISIEIRKDLDSGMTLTLNAYAAQHFIGDLIAEHGKRAAVYIYIKRFLVNTGIYREFDKENPALIWSSGTGRAKKETPDFFIDGKGYVFNRWLSREDA